MVNKRIILKKKFKKKSRKIQETHFLKTHSLLSGGTSSMLDKMGFLGFTEQMTSRKPDLEAGAACTSDASHGAGNAFSKGRPSLSQGENTPRRVPAFVFTPLSVPPTWPGSASCERLPAGWDLSSSPRKSRQRRGEAAWPFNAGRKHQNHFL